MDRPIRVLQVFAEMKNEGAQNMIMNLYRKMDHRQVQFDFMVHTEEECAFDNEIKELGGNIYRVPRYRGKNHREYVKAWKVFLAEHTEHKILHSHVRSTASIYIPIAKKYGLITVIHSHSTMEKKNFQGIVKRMFEYPLRFQADYLFACSWKAGEWLYGQKALKGNNFKVIPNAVDLKKFEYNEKIRKEVREELGLENKLVIGNVGRFLPTKNQRFAVDILKELLVSNSRYVLILAGDGEELENCRCHAENAGVLEYVYFLGNRKDVNRLYQAMDVFLFPSAWEGLPVTLIEAQTAGLACIITDTITSEVDIIDVYRKSLNESAAEWAREVERHTGRTVSQDRIGYIRKAGYDIDASAEWIQNFYLRCSRE